MKKLHLGVCVRDYYRVHTFSSQKIPRLFQHFLPFFPDPYPRPQEHKSNIFTASDEAIISSENSTKTTKMY